MFRKIIFAPLTRFSKDKFTKIKLLLKKKGKKYLWHFGSYINL